MITQRALLFGFVGFCFYLIAIVNALPAFYYALTWLTAGILFSSFGIALLSLFGLRCEWTMTPICIAETPSALIASAPNDDDFDDEPAVQSTLSGPDADPATENLGAEGLHVTLANGGTLHKTGLVLEVCLRAARNASTADFSADSVSANPSRAGTFARMRRAREARDELLVRRFLIEALPSGSQISTTLALRDLPRGRYCVQHVRLIGSDVLGLFRLRKTVATNAVAAYAVLSAVGEENGGQKASDVATNHEVDGAAAVEGAELVVGPAMVSLSSRAALQAGGGSGGLDSSGLMGQGGDVRGTRPYVAGDDLRFVHWKSTARRGELVVREFHRTARNQYIVIWDGTPPTFGQPSARAPQNSKNAAHAGAESVASADVAGAEADGYGARRKKASGNGAVEFGLRMAASLCRAISDSGQPCALLRLDSRALYVPPPGRDGGAADLLTRVTHALADADADRATPLTAAVAESLRGALAGSGVYLVTTAPGPDLVAAVRALQGTRAHVAVCIVDCAAFVAPPSTRFGWRARRNRLDAKAADQMPRPETLAVTAGALSEMGVSVVIAPNFAAAAKSLTAEADENGTAQNAALENGAGWNQWLEIRRALRLMLSTPSAAGASDRRPQSRRASETPSKVL